MKIARFLVVPVVLCLGPWCLQAADPATQPATKPADRNATTRPAVLPAKVVDPNSKPMSMADLLSAAKRLRERPPGETQAQRAVREGTIYSSMQGRRLRFTGVVRSVVAGVARDRVPFGGARRWAVVPMATGGEAAGLYGVDLVWTSGPVVSADASRPPISNFARKDAPPSPQVENAIIVHLASADGNWIKVKEGQGMTLVFRIARMKPDPWQGYRDELGGELSNVREGVIVEAVDDAPQAKRAGVRRGP